LDYRFSIEALSSKDSVFFLSGIVKKHSILLRYQEIIVLLYSKRIPKGEASDSRYKDNMKRENIISENNLKSLSLNILFLTLLYCIFIKTYNNIRTEMILHISFCATGFSFLPRC